MALDLTAFSAAMKELYSPDKLQELVLTDRPLLAICPKDEDFFGSHANQPTLIGNPQNTSATFASGQGLTTTSTLKAFLVTRASYYGFATIDNQTIKASANDAGAFAKALEVEIDGAMNSVSNSIAQQLYRSGWGELGTISSISGTVITLTNASSAFNFEIGMNIVFASTLSTSTLGSGTAVSVTGVDRSAGTITISGTTGSPAATNLIFRYGDRQNSATPSRLTISGLEAWVPFTAPTSGDSFMSIDRSSDSRLFGNRLDATALPIEEALIGGIEKAVANAGNPDYVFMNPVQYAGLVKALGSKVQYIDLEVPDTQIGFRGIEVQGPKGAVKVMQDIWCPGDRAYVVESKSMLLHSLGACPHLFDTDGLEYLRTSNADSVDVRITSYAQLRVLAPSHFCTVALAAA
jgi:hypothetical protein